MRNLTLEPQYSLGSGMRLDKGTAPELAHPHVSITLPNGSEGKYGVARH